MSYLANRLINRFKFLTSDLDCCHRVLILRALVGRHRACRHHQHTFGTKDRELNQKYIRYGVIGFVVLTAWIAAIVNPSVLSLIQSLYGTIIAMVLYLLPMYAIHKVEVLKPYRGLASNIFVTIAGIVAVSAIIYGLLP